MGILNRKKSKKIDLLEMSNVEKLKFIKAIKESLQQKAVEAKLWQSFVESDNLTINGESVHSDKTQLTGLSLKADILRSMQE
jgi:hypothetical protein